MTPRVSVIVPVYNVLPYLSRCVDSLCRQTLRDIEIICVDDGSTDGSADVLDEAARRDSRVKVVHQGNAGAGAARNRGLEEAQGDYLFFCDPDDDCERRLLKGMYDRARATSADVVVAGKTLVDAETGKVLGRKGFRREFWRLRQPFAADEIAGRIFSLAKSVPWDKLFRRDYIRRLGLRFQCLPRSNDVYFVDMAMAHASRIALDPHARYRYTVDRPGSLQQRKDRAPTATAEAYAALEAGLRERGLWAKFSQSYLSVYLLAMTFNVGRFVEPRNAEVCYRTLREVLVRFRDEDGLDTDVLPTPWQRSLHVMVLAEASSDKLRATLAAHECEGAKTVETWRHRLFRLLPFTLQERWKRLSR